MNSKNVPSPRFHRREWCQLAVCTAAGETTTTAQTRQSLTFIQFAKLEAERVTIPT